MGCTNCAWRGGLLVLTFAGFALRVHGLADVSLRWDEGWSIALAALPPREMLSLTAQDVHPPLYYLALGVWTPLVGTGVFSLRYASAVAATLAVPLAGVAARAWCPRQGPPGRQRWSRAAGPGPTAIAAGRGATEPGRATVAAGLAAAALAASAPGLIYYAGVARMYALTAPALLVAAWGVGRMVNPPRRGNGPAAALAAIGGSLAALHLFYYAAFAVAGLYVAGAAIAVVDAAHGPGRGRGRRRLPNLAATAAVTAVAAAPWMAYAAGALALRVTAGAAAPKVAATVPDIVALLGEGLKATFFAYRSSAAAVAAPLLAVVVAAVAAPRWLAPRLAVAALPVAAVVAAAAVGARAHMFAARYVIVATPFALLGVAWAVAALAGRRRGRAPVAAATAALLSAVAVTIPTTAGYVYQRSAEVTDAFDPAADWRALEPAGAADVAVFNILSLAGLYEHYRTPADPPWTYAQLWDPVHEPEERARRRVAAAAAQHQRLWLVLYKGTISPDSGRLKSWADRTFFPAAGFWAGDRLVQSYVVAAADRTITAGADFDGGVRLVGGRYTGRAAPGGGVGVVLDWTAAETPASDARVYLHLYDTAGELVAQSDGFPAFDTRPPTSWRGGEIIPDRRGLVLPPAPQGPLTLRVGLYDAESGRRWATADGDDGVTLGQVEVRVPPPG